MTALKNSMLLIMCVVLTALTGSDAMSQDTGNPIDEEMQRYIARIQALAYQIKGKDTPDNIPFGVKFSILVRNFENFKPELEASLSNSGIGALSSIGEAESSASASDESHIEAMWDSICANIDNLNSVTIAMRIKKIADTFHSKRAARYMASINQLSTLDRGNISHFIDTRITPGVVFSDTDGVALANEFPDLYKQDIRETCRQRASAEKAIAPGEGLMPSEKLSGESSQSSSSDQYILEHN